jgi:hypothetical protein
MLSVNVIGMFAVSIASDAFAMHILPLSFYDAVPWTGNYNSQISTEAFCAGSGSGGVGSGSFSHCSWLLSHGSGPCQEISFESGNGFW